MKPTSSLNVQSFLNEHPFSPYQWLIFALCFLIVLLPTRAARGQHTQTVVDPQVAVVA